MKKLAFITSEEDPNLIKDDQLAMSPLRSLGFEVSPLVWDRGIDEISSFDALIFRSCWNYHVKYLQFLEWLKNLELSRKPVLNPVEIGVWNLNKKYLLELANKGAPVPSLRQCKKARIP